MRFYFIVVKKKKKNEASCSLPWNVNKSTVVTITQPFPGWKEQKRMFCLLARTMVRHFICQISLYVQCFQNGICVLKNGKFNLTTLQIKNDQIHIPEYMSRFQEKEEHQKCSFCIHYLNIKQYFNVGIQYRCHPKKKLAFLRHC